MSWHDVCSCSCSLALRLFGGIHAIVPLIFLILLSSTFQLSFWLFSLFDFPLSPPSPSPCSQTTLITPNPPLTSPPPPPPLPTNVPSQHKRSRLCVPHSGERGQRQTNYSGFVVQCIALHTYTHPRLNFNLSHFLRVGYEGGREGV